MIISKKVWYNNLSRKIVERKLGEASIFNFTLFPMLREDPQNKFYEEIVFNSLFGRRS